MIRHLLRIVWNRRRTNLLISIEIFLSFLVLATVLILGSSWPTTTASRWATRTRTSGPSGSA